MPVDFGHARQLAARGIAATGKAFSRFNEGLQATYGRPGPDIKVSPFDAGEASTPAGLIKVGANIVAGMRANANYEQRRQDYDLERRKTEAEIGRLESDARRGDQPRPRAMVHLGADIPQLGYKAGADVDPVELQTRAGLHNTGTRNAPKDDTRGWTALYLAALNAQKGATSEKVAGDVSAIEDQMRKAVDGPLAYQRASVRSQLSLPKSFSLSAPGAREQFESAIENWRKRLYFKRLAAEPGQGLDRKALLDLIQSNLPAGPAPTQQQGDPMEFLKSIDEHLGGDEDEE